MGDGRGVTSVRRASALCVSALLLLWGFNAWPDAAAQPGTVQLFDEQAALQKSRSAVGRRLADHQLLTADGRRISISAFRGKPLLVSLIYTSCHHTCPTMTLQLAAAVAAARNVVGEDSFNILTVGFDTRIDTPDRLHRFAAERGIDDPRWTFASVDPLTVEALSSELGFTYVASPRGFDHLAQTTIVNAGGVVHQQVYGESIHAPALIEPLKQLVWDLEVDASSWSGWLKGVKLFCTVYDPATGRYEFEYSFFIGLAIGILALGSVAVFVVRAWRETGASRAA